MENLFKYYVGDDILSIIQSSIYECYKGRIDFCGPNPEREIIVETGFGGNFQLKNSIIKMVTESGLVITGELPKTEDNFLSYTIPFLATIKIRIDPSKDNNTMSEKMIKGFKISSYNYKIIDNDCSIVDILAIGERSYFYLLIRSISKRLNKFYKNILKKLK